MVVVAVVLAGCGSLSTSPAAGKFTPRIAGVLSVATSAYPTPGFWEGTPRRPTGGFEYELARLLAKRFGLRSVRIVLQQFPLVLAGDLGGADLALDLITPTSQREDHLDFSTPYLIDPPTVLVRQGTSVPDLATAQDLRWGAVRATTFVGDIEDQIAPDGPLRLFDQPGQLVAALYRRQIDAVLEDLPLAVVTANRSGGRLKAVAQLPTSETIAAALPKGSDNEQAVSSAIRAFMADGTIHDLLKRWVGSAAADPESSLPLLHTTRG
jgi:polar amino acid transport system substrate-binding protein